MGSHHASFEILLVGIWCKMLGHWEPFILEPDICSAKNLCILIVSKEFFLTFPISYTVYNLRRYLLPNVFSSGRILNLPDPPAKWDKEALWYLDCLARFIYSLYTFSKWTLSGLRDYSFAMNQLRAHSLGIIHTFIHL